jgi:hypothetical protein
MSKAAVRLFQKMTSHVLSGDDPAVSANRRNFSMDGCTTAEKCCGHRQAATKPAVMTPVVTATHQMKLSLS